MRPRTELNIQLKGKALRTTLISNFIIGHTGDRGGKWQRGDKRGQLRPSPTMSLRALVGGEAEASGEDAESPSKLYLSQGIRVAHHAAGLPRPE